MMKLFKKNQLAILVISLMLITAGYLNYDSNINAKTEETSADAIDVASIGDATLANADVTEENTAESSITSGEIVENKEGEAYTESTEQTTQETSTDTKPETNNSTDDYFATSKLERNVMYSQMIQRYQDILQSANGVTEQKLIAEQEINKLNDTQNAIMIAENLLTTKGFKDNIIFVNGESISVIIGKTELTQDEIAQIQNIISRELKADVGNIHISMK